MAPSPSSLCKSISSHSWLIRCWLETFRDCWFGFQLQVKPLTLMTIDGSVCMERAPEVVYHQASWVDLILTLEFFDCVHLSSSLACSGHRFSPAMEVSDSWPCKLNYISVSQHWGCVCWSSGAALPVVPHSKLCSWQRGLFDRACELSSELQRVELVNSFIVFAIPFYLILDWSAAGWKSLLLSIWQSMVWRLWGSGSVVGKCTLNYLAWAKRACLISLVVRFSGPGYRCSPAMEISDFKSCRLESTPSSFLSFGTVSGCPVSIDEAAAPVVPHSEPCSWQHGLFDRTCKWP